VICGSSPVASPNGATTLNPTIETWQQTLPHGITLSCRACGPKGRPVLLFLHGFPEAAFVWDDLLEHFAQPQNGGYRCIAPNMRGYEHSSAPTDVKDYRAKFLVQDIAALIDAECGPDRALAALVAHDWGGAVAWAVANAHPTRLRQLVIINSPHPARTVGEASPSLRFGPVRHFPVASTMIEETTVKMTKRIWIHSVVGAATAAALTSVAWAQGAPVKIGVLATLEGPFAAGGADGMRGAELAIRQRGGVVAGRKIEMVRASSNANPDVAVNAVRKLVEQDKVDLVVGPLSGGEGIAVKDYSKTQPNMTFINGGSGAQATTLQNPSPNFFRFNTEGAQWMVGLGKAAVDKGYKRVMVIAEDYAFPYSQVQGFMSEFCRLGGKVPVKAWVPLGGKDYSSVIARIPKDVDALLVVLGGADAVNFLNQYEASGGDKPMMGGSITVSQDVLNYRGKRRDSLVGTISAGPYADSFDGADWKAFVADYQKNYPVSAGGYPSPSLFALVYYTNMKAALDALEQVKGDLSGGQAKYREALSKLELKMPTGTVKLDSNRQAIGTTFVTEVVKDSKGDLTTRVLRKVDNVDQMLGMKREEFQMGSRDVPACP